jgi:hypothetical protein
MPDRPRESVLILSYEVDAAEGEVTQNLSGKRTVDGKHSEKPVGLPPAPKV